MPRRHAHYTQAKKQQQQQKQASETFKQGIQKTESNKNNEKQIRKKVIKQASGKLGKGANKQAAKQETSKQK